MECFESVGKIVHNLTIFGLEHIEEEKRSKSIHNFVILDRDVLNWCVSPGANESHSESFSQVGGE